jgi:hypothetical protein
VKRLQGKGGLQDIDQTVHCIRSVIFAIRELRTSPSSGRVARQPWHT